jgi:hypothetical protein
MHKSILLCLSIHSKSLYLSLIVGAFISIQLLGCTYTPKAASSCTERDWYEVGRHDGSQGRTMDRWNGYQIQCKNTLSDHTLMVYTNGRNAGLVEYCLPENALQLGLTGLSYLFVCPTTSEAKFLAAFKRGQEMREAEKEHQRFKRDQMESSEAFERQRQRDQESAKQALEKAIEQAEDAHKRSMEEADAAHKRAMEEANALHKKADEAPAIAQ